MSLRDYLVGVAAHNRANGIDPATIAYDPAAVTRLEAAVDRQYQRDEANYVKRREAIVAQNGGPGVARDDIVAAAATMTWKLGGGREIKKLTEHLHPGEIVRKIGQGTYRNDQGIVVLTDQRLLFLFHGVTRRSLEDFPLSSISSVATNSGLATGVLKVFASGNEAAISNIVNPDLEPLADALRQELARGRAESGPPSSMSGGSTDVDPIDQIARLAALRDQGVLTDPEFEAKKAELLGRL